MHKTSTRLPPSSQIERLELRHSALKHQIAALDGQRFLTLDERARMDSLKKERLATKDELVGLRERSSAR